MEYCPESRPGVQDAAGPHSLANNLHDAEPDGKRLFECSWKSKINLAEALSRLCGCDGAGGTCDPTRAEALHGAGRGRRVLSVQDKSAQHMFNHLSTVHENLWNRPMFDKTWVGPGQVYESTEYDDASRMLDIVDSCCVAVKWQDVGVARCK